MLYAINNGGLVVWLLLAMGLFAILVFLERLFNLHRAQIAADDFLFKGQFGLIESKGSVPTNKH